MKAAVYRRYGSPDVVQVEDIEKPIPADNEVLIRIYATTVCAADWRMRKADPFFIRFMMGFWRPRKIHVLGVEFAGETEAVGIALAWEIANGAVFRDAARARRRFLSYQHRKLCCTLTIKELIIGDHESI